MDIDQVASSGRDGGAGKFAAAPKYVSAKDALKEVFGNFNLSLDHTVTIYDSNILKLTATASSGTQIAGGSGSIAITKDGISSVDLSNWIYSNTNLPDSSTDILINKSGLAKAFAKIKEGNMTIKSSINSDKSYSVSIALDIMKTDAGYLENTLSVEFEGTLKIDDSNSNLLSGVTVKNAVTIVALGFLAYTGIGEATELGGFIVNSIRTMASALA